METKGSDSAFPIGQRLGDFAALSGGLSKLEIFAAVAMHGILSCPPMLIALGGRSESKKASDDIPRLAVTYAKSLIRELNESTPASETPEGAQ